MQKRNRLTDIENKLMVTKGKKDGSKRNCQQNEKQTYQMGENVCKSCI